LNNKGIYLYGFVKDGYDTENLSYPLGSEVYTVTCRDVTAVVSDMEKIDFTNLNMESLAQLLVHHQKTIEDIMNSGCTAVVPFRLGTILNNKKELLKITETGYDLISDTFAKTENNVELDVVATWSDFGGIIEKFSQHPDIKDMKEKIMSKGANVQQSDQIEIGKLFKSKIDEVRDTFAARITELLSPLSKEMKAHEVMNDQMVLNTAFLIKGKMQEEFENIINAIDEEFKGELNFKIVGPLPCYSFYTIELKEFEYDLIEEAGNELALSGITSAKDIKDAFKQMAKKYHPDKDNGNDNSAKYNRISDAYHTLLDYSLHLKKKSTSDSFSLEKEDVLRNLMSLKMKY
jgi:hypothetical protein